MIPERIYKTTALEKGINLLFIFLFVYTASSKLIQHQLFRTTLFQSPLLAEYTGFLSWAVPAVELLVVAALFSVRYRKAGSWVALLLMVVFTSYVGFMIWYTPDLPCSCGGIISALTWRQHLALNIILSCLALVQVLVNNKTADPEHSYSHAYR